MHHGKGVLEYKDGGLYQFILANANGQCQCADADAIVMIPMMVSFLERRIEDMPILRVDSDRHLTSLVRLWTSHLLLGEALHLSTSTWIWIHLYKHSRI